MMPAAGRLKRSKHCFAASAISRAILFSSQSRQERRLAAHRRLRTMGFALSAASSVNLSSASPLPVAVKDTTCGMSLPSAKIRSRAGKHSPAAFTSAVKCGARCASSRSTKLSHPANAAQIGRMPRETPKPRNSKREPYMGSVDRSMAGCDASDGRRAVTPPRRRTTSKGGGLGHADNAASLREMPPNAVPPPAFSRALAMRSALSQVESTSKRRLTTHHILVGAVRSLLGSPAWEANDHRAISKQAVFPIPVGTPISCGHLPSFATCAASRDCQGNGGHPCRD